MINDNSTGTATLSEQSGEFQLQAITDNFFHSPGSSENITFTVSDGIDFVLTTIPIIIQNVNDPPTANPTTKTVSENNVVPDGMITLTGESGPNEADTLTFIITGLPQGGTTTGTSGLLFYATNFSPFFNPIYNQDLTNGEFDLSVSSEPNPALNDNADVELR